MNNKTYKLSLSAMFVAIGVVLPLITGQIKEIGDTLLPMHLPVMLCGFICGGFYGGIAGLVLPFVRFLIFGMPPLYPNAVWMALEMATYGIVSGCVYSCFSEKTTKSVYISLVSAMVSGRIVWGITKWLLIGMSGKSFTLSMFIAGAFTDAIPGIILQLAVVPVAVFIYNKRINR